MTSRSLPRTTPKERSERPEPAWPARCCWARRPGRLRRHRRREPMSPSSRASPKRSACSTTPSAPRRSSVAAGTEVVWENGGRNDHNVLPVDGDDWGVEADDFAPGDAYRHRFTEPGTYAYYCSLHGTTTAAWSGRSSSPADPRSEGPPCAAPPASLVGHARRPSPSSPAPAAATTTASDSADDGADAAAQHPPRARRPRHHPGRGRRRRARRPHPHRARHLRGGRRRRDRGPHHPRPRPQRGDPRRRLRARERHPRPRPTASPSRT